MESSGKQGKATAGTAAETDTVVTETYCVSSTALGPLSSEPTHILALDPRPNEVAEYRSFVGYPATFTGKLVGHVIDIG